MRRIWSLFRCSAVNGTWGVLVVPGLGQFVTAEAPWVSTGEPGFDAGTPFKSCLPTGLYELVLHDSPKFGKDRIHLRAPGVVSLDPVASVPRSDCLFHDMYRPTGSKGCIGTGMFVINDGGAPSHRLANPNQARLQLERFIRKTPQLDHYLHINALPGMSFTQPEVSF